VRLLGILSTLALASCARSSPPPAPATFADAVAQVEALTGAKGRDGKSPDGDPLDGVVLFSSTRGWGSPSAASPTP